MKTSKFSCSIERSGAGDGELVGAMFQPGRTFRACPARGGRDGFFSPLQVSLPALLQTNGSVNGCANG